MVSNDAMKQTVQMNKTEQTTECAVPSASLFALPAEKIAESLASKDVSPQGAVSGIRLLTFYINYAGRRLSTSRRRTLEKARKLLSDRVVRETREKERQKVA